MLTCAICFRVERPGSGFSNYAFFHPVSLKLSDSSGKTCFSSTGVRIFWREDIRPGVDMGHGQPTMSILSLMASSALLILGSTHRCEASQPNIVFIMADDLGFNDVGYHMSHIRTPHIDKLSREGVRLNNYYVQPICTPTRSVFMSGRYQIHTGLQHGVIGPNQAMALPLGSPTLADKLSQAGYSTYGVGKWHLGFYKKKYLPTRRGFDRFYGFYTGSGDHFRHNRCLKGGCGVDLHDDTRYTFSSVFNESGTYSTHLYTRKAVDLIQAHSPRKPFFLYLAYQAVHGPLQVPHSYKQEYLHIPDASRRIFAAMTSAMDDGVGEVVAALKRKGFWNNTVLVFSTDNGADPMNGGSNWPYRGRKGEWFEGGVRGVGFVASPLLDKKKYTSKALIHVADWFPTFVKLAKGNMDGTSNIAGIDQWEVISRQAHSKKIMILHGIDPMIKSDSPVGNYSSVFDVRISAAIRIGDYKLITGPCAEKKCKRRINKPNKNRISSYQSKQHKKWLQRRHQRRWQQAKLQHRWKQSKHMKEVKQSTAVTNFNQLTAVKKSNRLKAVKKYNQPIAMKKSNQPTAAKKYNKQIAVEAKHTKDMFQFPLKLIQLYNIRKDPLEKYDMARKLPKIVRTMLNKLQEFYVTSVPPCYPINEYVAPVKKAWGPWKDGIDSQELCPLVALR